MKKNIVRVLWNNLWINPGVRDIELTGMCDLISGVQKSTLSLFSACAYSNHCRKKNPRNFPENANVWFPKYKPIANQISI